MSGSERYPLEDIGARSSALERSECPDCGSENGYWKRGSVADFDWLCKDCGGIFDETTTERRAESSQYPTGDNKHTDNNLTETNKQ